MAGKRFRAEQIIMKLREAEVGLAQGQRVGQVSKQMGVSEQTYYRWRKEYGGLRLGPTGQEKLKVFGEGEYPVEEAGGGSVATLDKQILRGSVFSGKLLRHRRTGDEPVMWVPA